MSDTSSSDFIQSIYENSLLENQRRQFPIKTSSTESFEELLRNVGGVQSARAMAQALDQELEPKTKQGFLDFLFSQEKGIISMPLRFSTAFLVDALGGEGRFEELQDSNPLQSAIRSARGDFAITGGDLIKTDADDSIPTRLAKWTGALAIDIAADPLSWVGGVGTIARKTVGEVAINQSDRILASAVKLSGNPTKMIDDLFQKSSTLARANEQRLAGAALDPDTPMAVLKMTPDGAVPNAIVNEEAGRVLATQIAESLDVKGRAGVRELMAKVLGSEDLALKFMDDLPQEISGGLFLKNPITGKAITRIAGGRGATNPIFQQVNRARFGAAASPVGRFFTDHFAGRAGPVLSAVRQNLWNNRKGMEEAIEAGLPGGQRFIDVVAMRNGARIQEKELLKLSNRTVAWISAPSILKESVKPEYADEFDKWFKLGFSHPGMPVPPTISDTGMTAWSAAKELRRAVQELHRDLRAAGVEIDDLGEDWVMKVMTKDGVEEMRRQGRKTGEYNPSMKRDSGTAFSTDKDALAEKGYEAKGFENAVFVTGMEANARRKAAGETVQMWEEDPLVMAQKYMEWGNRALANQRLMSYLAEMGTITVVKDQARLITDDLMATALYRAINKTAKGAKNVLRERASQARQALEAMVSEDTQEELIAQVNRAKTETNAIYLDAKRNEDAARAALRQADAQVAATTPNIQQLADEFIRYGELGAEGGVALAQAGRAEAERIRRNATARLARANTNVEDSVNIAALADEIGTEADVIEAAAAREAAESKAQREAEAYEKAFLSLEEARAELAGARQFQEANSQRMGAGINQQYQAHVQALEQQVLAAESLDRARQARIQAKKARDAAKADSTLERVAAIDTAVFAHVDATTRRRMAQYSYDRALKNIGRRTPTPQEMAEIEQLRAGLEASQLVFEETKSIMESVVGKAVRGKTKNTGKLYVNKVYQLAGKLSAEEFQIARLLGDFELMDQVFTNNVFEFDRDIGLSMVGDMFQAFKNIREFITPEDLALLNANERAIYAATGPKGKGPVGTVFGQEMYAGKAGVAAVSAGLRDLSASEKNLLVPRAMKDAYANKGVLDVFEDMYRMLEDPTGFKKFLNNIVDPLLLVWKTAVTVGRGPGYTVTNIVGGLQNNYLGGVGAKEHAISAKVILSVKKNFRKIEREFGDKISYPEKVDMMVKALTREFDGVTIKGARGTVNVAEAFAESIERGMALNTRMVFDIQELQALGTDVNKVFLTPQQITAQFRGRSVNKTDAAWRNVIGFLLTNKYQTAMNDLAQMSELYLRFAAVLGGIRKFGDMDSAMSFMHMLHFDYQDLSGAEVWLKRFVPFYTWTRNNVPLQIRHMFVTTDKMAKLVRANENTEEAFGVDGESGWINEVLPEYMDELGGFASVLKFNGNHIGLFPKLPFKDVDQWLEIRYIAGVPVPAPRLNEAAESLGPILSPIAFITNTNLREGREYQNRGEAITELAQGFVPYAGVISRALSGAAVAVPAIENINKVPGVSLVGLDVQRDKGLTGLFQLLAGAPFGATTLTERTIAGGARATSRDYNEQLAKMAAEANVDLDWLRKELRSGASVDQLRAKIRAGQGNPQLIALRKKMEGAPKRRSNRDYREVLQGLGSGGLQTGY